MPDIKTYVTTKGALLAVPTPEDTRTYKSVSHERLIDLTLEGIARSGFALDREVYSMAREGKVANGRYTISSVADSEMQIQIGWQNSLNKSISLKWAMGVHIFICSNGCISGDMGAFKKKHQGEVQTFTPHAIAEYIKTAEEVFLSIQTQRDSMKQIELSKRVIAELLGRMVIEEQFITTTQLNIIKRELEHPTFDYGAPNSLWELYQFVTYSLKEDHPSLWMQDHIDAHNFFTNAAGILVPITTTIDITTEDKRQLNLFEDLYEAPASSQLENEELYVKEFEGVVVYNSDEEEYDGEIEPERGDED